MKEISPTIRFTDCVWCSHSALYYFEIEHNLHKFSNYIWTISIDVLQLHGLDYY